MTQYHLPTGPSQSSSSSSLLLLGGPVAPVAPVYPLTPAKPQAFKQSNYITSHFNEKITQHYYHNK